MKLVVQILQALGFTSENGDRVARAKAFVAVTVLWVILPGLVYVVRQHSSNFGAAMKSFEEVVLIAKVVLHASKTIRNRVELEQIFNDLEEALGRTCDKLNGEIQRKLAVLERRLNFMLNVYLRFEMFAIVGYCLLPPTVFIIRYLIETDQLLDFPNTSFEAEYVINFPILLIIIFQTNFQFLLF